MNKLKLLKVLFAARRITEAVKQNQQVNQDHVMLLVQAVDNCSKVDNPDESEDND